MAPSPKKPSGRGYPCKLALQALQSCLVNLPPVLVTTLNNANAVAQNVVVELVYRQAPQSGASGSEGRPVLKSVYVGWTGWPSKNVLASVVGREGRSEQKETPMVEIDATFARLIGLNEEQQVDVSLHTNFPQVHTVNIDPLTSADWEIIELHAGFLEFNMLSQIRALPNPGYSSASKTNHPLTLHLSPTSTANVTVSSMLPAVPASSPFAKIAPDAEVIVAPKTRQKPVMPGIDNSSATSTDGKSTTSASRNRRRNESRAQKPTSLRGVNRKLASEWFDDEEEADRDQGLRVWVDWTVLTSKAMRGVSWVWVSVVRPPGLQAPQNQPQQPPDGQDSLKPTTRVVAQLLPWEDAPDTKHVALSSSLCSSLDADDLVGDAIRLEAAPTQVPKNTVRAIRVFPFATASDKPEGLKFGGQSRADREEAAQWLLANFGKMGDRLFDGPITDGMVLPPVPVSKDGVSWDGGIIKFDPPPGPPLDEAKLTRGWFLGSERRIAADAPPDINKSPSSQKAFAGGKTNVEVMAEIPKPASAKDKWAAGEPITSMTPDLVGIESLLSQLSSNVKHHSSVLLTGGAGSGKTSIAQLIASRFRHEEFYHTTYFPCQSLVTDETRMQTIKDTLNRIFGLAAWGTRLGGSALVILDDIDKLCPVETELQVGDENSQSRQKSELLISTVEHYCSTTSRVVLLATAKSKEDINNAIIGAHVVEDIVAVQAPDKDKRRQTLDAFIYKGRSKDNSPEPSGKTPNALNSDGDGWLDGMSPTSDTSSERDWPRTLGEKGEQSEQFDAFAVDEDLDVLDIAGQTDGYMPGDLHLLVSRARSEAMMRAISSGTPADEQLRLTQDDFAAALKGFTPSSLRNVTLQHSSTTFADIGGLGETRQMLLETLQYPTLYAPIFASCPLRLRSGLLLYGYPGCGKTLLASAVAGECGLNFISVKGPEILNKYIGASEKSVRDLFERAQAARPCVLFFDEFDSIAPKRGHDSTGVTDRVVNQLLTQMDGAEGLSGVYVLAATSRPDLVDPALLRPGRLDKSLLCDMPAYADRLDILRALAGKLRLDPAVAAPASENLHNGLNGDAAEHATTPAPHTLEEVAARTQGYSGADLQAVVYNAQLEAIHDALGGSAVSSTSRTSKSASAADDTAKSAGTAVPDFTYFRLGAEAEPDSASAAEHDPPLSAAAAATERAKIAADLATHRAALAKAKAAKSAPRTGSAEYGVGNSGGGGGGGSGASEDKASRRAEPVVAWRHIERSLAQTRPSISVQEVRRLARIYREFAVGRNGEMPSGQGGTEIGGRTSLA